jgi:hypothetical protein
MEDASNHLINAARAMDDAERHLVSAVAAAGPSDRELIVFVGALQKLLRERAEAMASPVGG